MKSLGDILGYKFGRTMSKLILLSSAIAISTFAVSVIWLKDFFSFDFFGLTVSNIIALSLIVIALLIKDYNVLNPPSLHIIDNRNISKTIYYILLGLIGISISTISFPILDNLLNYTFLGLSWLAIRNIIAGLLILIVRRIHLSG